QISSVSGYLEYTEDNYIPQGMWYREYLDMGFTTYELVDVDQFNYNKLVGVPFDNGIGPIFTPKNATEIILNFVSVNGFYKLNQNNEVAIIAQIRVTVYELDINGDETGNSTPFVIDYESNPDKVRNSVFQTARLELPYTYSKVFAERITNRDKTKEISNVDVIEWR